MMLKEENLVKIAKPYFEHCRAGDWNHALRVIKWVKILGKGRKDINLLITAAYLHDIGWSGVIQKGLIDFDNMLKFEAKANENTPRYVMEVLEKLMVKEEEINVIIRLIKAADKHRSQLEDEYVLVDADNLSKLCLEHLKEKYKPDSYPKLIKTWEEELPERIKTQQGKESWPKLLENLKKDLGLK
ncbi:MAG: HD domain-containing protein [Nanoarchaeota archaeon]|nr:HD domain-containing protein [Nanoarchaeota archaeon]